MLRSFPHPHRLTWIIGCVALVPLIALGDYATGYELSLAILYLVPIFAATWVLGRGYGISISVFALVSWLISVHFMGFAYAHPFYHLWEALIRLVTWVIFVLLLARLRVALAHVRFGKLRWRIERDYQELKGELGLDHFEGRTWAGFHHHVALCAAAHAFLARRRALFPPERTRVDARRGAPSPASALAHASATLPAVSATDRQRASTARPVAHVIR